MSSPYEAGFLDKCCICVTLHARQNINSPRGYGSKPFPRQASIQQRRAWCHELGFHLAGPDNTAKTATGGGPDARGSPKAGLTATAAAAATVEAAAAAAAAKNCAICVQIQWGAAWFTWPVVLFMCIQVHFAHLPCYFRASEKIRKWIR